MLQLLEGNCSEILILNFAYFAICKKSNFFVSVECNLIRHTILDTSANMSIKDEKFAS